MKIVLINGESRLLINEAINNIIKDNKNVTSFDMGINSMDDVLLEAGYFSMFLEEKFIISYFSFNTFVIFFLLSSFSLQTKIRVDNELGLLK